MAEVNRQCTNEAKETQRVEVTGPGLEPRALIPSPVLFTQEVFEQTGWFHGSSCFCSEITAFYLLGLECVGAEETEVAESISPILQRRKGSREGKHLVLVLQGQSRDWNQGLLELAG